MEDNKTNGTQIASGNKILAIILSSSSILVI